MIKQSRREFVKKAAYIQPVILTWPLRPRTQRQGLIKSIPIGPSQPSTLYVSRSPAYNHNPRRR